MLVHLSVTHCHYGLRHQLGYLIRNLLYAPDPVKYHVNLTSTAKLTLYDFLEKLVILFQYIGLHRVSFLRRLLDQAHVLDARQ